jgi:hypothetical protein
MRQGPRFLFEIQKGENNDAKKGSSREIGGTEDQRRAWPASTVRRPNSLPADKWKCESKRIG